ncbi:MAG: ribosome maturation factor RimM [Oscillospiraceae bacterium]
MKKYLEAGKAVTTHGINGELKIYPWCDSAESLKNIKTLFLDENGTQTVEVQTVKLQKNMNIIKLRNVDSVEEARKYIDRVFYVDRNDIEIPKDSYFICDLLGLGVFDADTGEHYGELSDVTNNGAHDLYHIKLENGEIRMIPAVPQFVISTDIDGGRLEIRPIKGMLSDED